VLATALKRFFTPPASRIAAHSLYNSIVAQARKPVFYADWHTPDTLDGRFDIIVIHLFLAVSRCETDVSPTQEDTKSFIRTLSEVFFSDMDRNLREMGASDTGVGIRVKKMAQAFYGRLKAYEESIHDQTALGEALRRNVWREQPVAAAAIAELAAYMQRNHKALQSQPINGLMNGSIQFSD
jgi:cytochrome b pre-mRNA-processing protein 3